MAPDNIAQDLQKVTQLIDNYYLLESENAHLKARLQWLEKQIFGQKADRMPLPPSALQASLFGESNTPQEKLPPKLTAIATHTRSEKGHGRKAWPASLERVHETIVPTDEELLCSVCNKKRTQFDDDITEVLERVANPFFA